MKTPSEVSPSAQTSTNSYWKIATRLGLCAAGILGMAVIYKTGHLAGYKEGRISGIEGTAQALGERMGQVIDLKLKDANQRLEAAGEREVLLMDCLSIYVRAEHNHVQATGSSTLKGEERTKLLGQVEKLSRLYEKMGTESGIIIVIPLEVGPQKPVEKDTDSSMIKS